jgi:2-oxo-4-hydroxy-4-carboxy-5-ureidoimidazoline decarboxylase
MSGVLARWNGLAFGEAAEEILPCCGSKTWAQGMAARRPIEDEAALLRSNDKVCRSLSESDWDEAFLSHPRIGESHAPAAAAARSAGWSSEEQRNVSAAGKEIKLELALGNHAYEQLFGRTFIVCASGKSPAELLDTLRRRMRNDKSTEFHEAAEQQRQIARLRLKKWLNS